VVFHFELSSCDTYQSLFDTLAGGRVAGRPVAKRDIKANSAELKLELGVSLATTTCISFFLI
jgi:hypothetical protein